MDLPTDETTVSYAVDLGREDGGIQVVVSADAAMKQPNAKEFIRRIYLILTIQLLITCGVTISFVKVPVINTFVIANFAPMLMITSGLLFTIMIFLLLKSCIGRMSLGFLAFILGAFAILMGTEVAIIVTMDWAAGSQTIVLQAFAITMAVFVSLTIFVFQTKIDFSFLGGFLVITTVALCVWSLIIYFMGYQHSFWFSLIGAILFGLWILYDTSLIIERSKYLEHGEVPSWKEAFIYATNLYTDIVNLFLFILDLMR